MRIGLHDEGLVLLTPEIPGEPSEAVRRERGGNGFRGKEASRTAETRSVEAVFDEPPAAPAMERAACYGTTDLQIIAFELLR